MSHTKEPWAVHRHIARIIPAEHMNRPIGAHEDAAIDRETYAQEICAMHWPDRNRSEDEVRANARRIVACVNACEGLPTELIEKHGVTRSGIAKGVAELTKQRDELAAFIQGWLERQGDDVSYMTEKARAALAAVKDRGNAGIHRPRSGPVE
jgi:hypothetical protein